MNRLETFGSNWGGWRIDPSKIRDGSTVISVGIGPDCTFDAGLLVKFPNLKVVAVDPTPAAANTIKNAIQNNPSFDRRLSLVPKALFSKATNTIALGNAAVTIFADTGLDYETISLEDLLKDNQNVCLLKMDIEGSEYSVLEELEELTVDQFCVEWHHWLDASNKTVEDTRELIFKIESFGY